MISVWRLTRRVHATPARRAFDGVGAEVRGGRWNRIGTKAAFASATRSLAALEYLANVDPEQLPSDLVFVGATVDEADVHVARPPSGWDRIASTTAKSYGDRWLRARRGLALAVPSAIVKAERNYVINPVHPDIRALRVADELEPFRFDHRLLKGAETAS